MNSPHALGDPAELAALYVAGALSPAELAEYELHLAGGCSACLAELRSFEAVADDLYAATPAEAPPAAIRAAVLARVAGSPPSGTPAPQSPQIWRQWANDDAASAMLVRRAADSVWEPVGIEGIEIRRLFVDRERDQATMLVRMAPGTAYPRHVHHGPEECFVLQGDLNVGGEVLRAGDYQRAAPRSQHGVQSTTGGCLLLIISSLSDELE